MKKKFTLSMRNEKGQVGIFVALIFQVIFVFFAMLVNVGLIVHHKINLQQSTDLAAYYGAMKQAEIMNVMAHMNYQIRQSWKLLAWRYRILGTFGMERGNVGGAPATIQFPVQWGADVKPRYNTSNADNFKCTGPPKAAGLTLADVPFACMGHDGFADWISGGSGGSGGGSETFCKISCSSLDVSFPFSIPTINPTNGFMGLGQAINTAIGNANLTVRNVCKALGPTTLQMLGLYYGNYITDTQNRKMFISMLSKDLSLPEDKILDIEGKKIVDGAESTLKKNLTEANLASIGTITTFNGAKNRPDLMKEVAFQKLLFFLIRCVEASGAPGSNNKTGLMSLYDGGGNVDQDLVVQTNQRAPGAGDQLRDLFNLNSANTNTLGFEKNPWVQVYYGVKATSQPKIPFLPLAKVKLHAISFAKPFGGSIGPWYFNKWDQPSDKSGDGDLSKRTDLNLPIKDLGVLDAAAIADLQTLKGARELLPNYSNFVNDNKTGSGAPDPTSKGGLANIFLVAHYHNMLANKQASESNSVNASANKTSEPKRGSFIKPDLWPRYAEWFHLGENITSNKFDPLALDYSSTTPKNTYMRDIELTVVAPNQFDSTYYSIEPDYHHNYFLKLKNSVNAIANAASVGTPPEVPRDLGNTGEVSVSGIPQDFGVRHQLQVTKELFKDKMSQILGIQTPSGPQDFFFNFIATVQSSLLTGWTYGSSRDYIEFPAPISNGTPDARLKMQFGTCDKGLNPWSDSFGSAVDDDNKPPVPGNCVTGGRTGYSVKLISSDMVMSGRTFNGIGGPGTSGEIKNPVEADFLRF